MTATVDLGDARRRLGLLQGLDGVTKLAGAQLLDALEGCRNGNGVDCEWLQKRGVDFLALLSDDPNRVEYLAGQLVAVATGGRPIQLGLGIAEWR